MIQLVHMMLYLSKLLEYYISVPVASRDSSRRTVDRVAPCDIGGLPATPRRKGVPPG